MSQPETNRNLLFAIMAVQMDFVPRDAMFSAMVAWTEQKATPLGQILVDRGELSPARRSALDVLIDEHIKAHANDPARSLQALSSTDGVADLLTRVPDTDLQASLGNLRDHGRTQIGSDSPADLATMVPSAVEPLAPWTGRFRVVRKHAEGGLGIVSVAIDDELDREVAFKEIKPRHADRRDSQARFVMEAEITGKLEHPGIVPIYGLGHDPMGRPYYAMRFIRGDSLADAINRFHDPNGPYTDPTKRALQLRELLARFLDVCDALSYAHSRGVLHRDLKPGNVMLGPFGETLVVDWGLAMPLDVIPDGTGATVEPIKTSKADSGSLPSERGAVVGTPQYMPPEQANGDIDQLGPRSDVYGLGAILYDLLVGCHPVTGATSDEILAAVRQGKIQPPRKICPDVPRALEAICLKALSLRPNDRYSGPQALAAEIKSWLADEPVNAYREPLHDQIRRWSRHHRVLVSTFAASLLVGVVGLSLVLAIQDQNNRILTAKNLELDRVIKDRELQARRAEEREQDAIEAVKKFRDVIIDEPILKEVRFKALRDRLVQAPQTFFRSLRERLLAQNDTRPESLSRLADAGEALGSLIYYVGNRGDALRVLQETVQVREKLVSTDLKNMHYLSSLAYCRGRIGVLLAETGRLEESLAVLRAAEEVCRRLVAAHDDRTEYQALLAYCLGNIAGTLKDMEKTDESLATHRAAADIYQKLVDSNSDTLDLQVGLAQRLNAIGDLLMSKGKRDEALETHRAALALLQRVDKINPQLANNKLHLAATYDAIGNWFRLSDQAGEAIQSMRAALAIYENLAKTNPDFPAYQRNWAGSLNNIGLLLASTGKTDEALEAHRTALAIQQRVSDTNPEVIRYRQDVANSYDNIGNLLQVIGKATDASDSYRIAKSMRDRIGGVNPSSRDSQRTLATRHENSARSLSSIAGKLGEAIEAQRAALVIRRKLVEAYPDVEDEQSELGGNLNSLSTYLKTARQLKEALEVQQSALDLQEKLVTSNPKSMLHQSNLAICLQNISFLLRDIGESDRAAVANRRALEIRRKLAKNHPEVTAHLDGLSRQLSDDASTEFEANRLVSAKEKILEAIDLDRKILATNLKHARYRKYLTGDLHNLILICQKQNDQEGLAAAQRDLDTILREDQPLQPAQPAQGLRTLLATDPALQELDARLSAIIKGATVRDEDERAALTQRAAERGLHVIAAQLMEETLTNNPGMPEDRRALLRYHAACAASLAGTGQSKDVPPPGEQEKARLRSRSLSLLQSELRAWEAVLDLGQVEEKELIYRRLETWANNADFAGLREPEALPKLPETERKAWEGFWKEVERLRAKAK